MKDGSGESNDTDTINVMIQVKDLDEHPVITGNGNVQHNENDTGTVLTLVANDPERVTPIHWDLVTTDIDADLPGGIVGDDIADTDVADSDLFEVENGVLTFAGSPNFEGMSDSDDDFYQAVVQASDGGLTAWVQYFEITVEVLDLEEEGEVNWTVAGDGNAQTPGELLEFQPDAVLAASVTDPDSGTDAVTDITWQWYRSTSSTGGWRMIDNAITASYTVQDDVNDNDVGNYLRVVARYTDGRGSNEEAEKISEYKVIPRKVNANSVPEFAPMEHNRRIQENAATGTAVGGMVTATDADGDVLNYTLVTTTELFDIDQATGQVMVAASLNYEAIRDDNDTPQGPDATHNAGTWALINNDDGTTSLNYVLEVRATDSAGDETGGANAPDHATVTITLLNVNEAPDFAVENRDATPAPANIRGMADDRHEQTTAPPTGDFPDEVAEWNAVVSSYTATDPEGVVLDGSKWSLSGDDAAQFKLTVTTDGTRTLEFGEAVDFENPGDRNRDNIYEVTVVVSDGSESSELDVTVKVLDSDEPGVITFAPDANPVAGTAIRANLSDSDGDVINVAWQWYTKDSPGDAAAPITGATTDTYTPEGDDIGKYLEVTASYMDRTEDEDNNATNNPVADGFVRFANMVTSADTAPVIDDPANAQPVFVEGAMATRYVEEDNVPGEAAGRTPVEDISRELLVTDEDPNATHAFTLSGADVGYFDIEVGDIGGGHLMTKARLDYETRNTYTVVVTANDGSGESNATASITVTIEVKDLDEKPEIFESGLVVKGSSSVAYMENGTADVATYTAEGSMADMASLTLMVGDDARYFTLTNGVLTFKRSPDYEMPRGMAMSDTNTNTYMVTVKATDGTYTDMREVTVTVTDVDEIGRLSGPLTVSHMENSTDAATYTVSGTMADDARWTRMGADAADFTITGGMLKFINAPDYESPMGGADNDSNTYMVTVKAEAGGEMEMVEVTVMVTNEEELGTLTADMVSPISHPENSMDTVATYTASGPMADNAMWTTMGADADYFTVMGGMLKFKMAPDYEMPRGMAMSDSNSNTYMVTVKAEAGGEMAMQEVTVMVTNEEELGTLTADMVSPISYMENGTMTVATYTASGPMADNAIWTLDEAGTADFTITGGMLEFKSAPDYENPMGGADDDTNTYMVTVKAEAGRGNGHAGSHHHGHQRGRTWWDADRRYGQPHQLHGEQAR